MPSRHTGPQPPAGRQFCVLCAADWKAQAVAIARERKLDPGGDVDLSALMGTSVPDLGVAETVLVLPVPGQGGQMMVIPGLACWSHLMAMKVLDSQLALGSPGGGGVLLGGG